MSLGVQIVSLAIVVTILFNYFQNKRMPLFSTRLFTVFLLLAFANILFEFTTLYTISRINEISPWLNRFCHQMFIGSLDCMTFFLFLYVDTKVRSQQRYTLKELAIRAFPLIAAMSTVVCGKLYYYIGEDGRYSYGPMANTVYISVITYVTIVMYQLYKHKEHFSEQERNTIGFGIIVWAVLAIFNFLNPTKVISSMAVMLMVLFVYLSMENPREYADYEIKGILNQRAFDMMLRELVESRRSFYIISIALVNERVVTNTLSYDAVMSTMCDAISYLEGTGCGKVYHSGETMVSVITTKRKPYMQFINQKREVVVRQSVKNMPMISKLRISALECPLYAKTIEAVRETLTFVREKPVAEQLQEFVIVNKEIIDRKNYGATIERMLQEAINQDGLEVYYQPIYSVRDASFVSAEALVRLKDTDTLGFVSPEIFIPIAEKRGMVVELGNIVFEKVCKFFHEKELQAYGVKYIEVNISGKQSVDERLPKMLLQCLKKYEIQPQCINLEITETATVEVGDMFQDMMQELQQQGCTFSMDDFGTGYSNLAKMADTNFDLIKLDKSLIWPCFEENGTGAVIILESCIKMIHNLGKEIVAEGVETKEQADFLISHGVNYLQGYYYARPVAEEKYLQFLNETRKA